MDETTLLESVLKRDRWPILTGLFVVTGLSWLYLFVMARDMGSMAAMAAPAFNPWSALDWALMFLMWSVMMFAMMLPSATPLVLIYARVHRQAKQSSQPFAPTAAFAAGYLVAWTAFSVVATVLQWVLERAALLSPMMISTSDLLGSILLIATGIYQLTPLKDACLEHCRSPLHFVMHHWRSGLGGALYMGIRHGMFCVGCCWFLMGLLFVGGVMNLLWIAAIGAFVLVEKVVPRGELIAKVSGALFLVAGLWILVR